MVHAYWLIGREIVEVEQHGAGRASYGERLMKFVAARLSARFGKGFSLASLKRTKQFYLAFPRGSALVGAGDGKGSTAVSLFVETNGDEKGSATVSLFPGASLLFPPSLAWSHHLVLLRVPPAPKPALVLYATLRQRADPRGAIPDVPSDRRKVAYRRAVLPGERGKSFRGPRY